MLLTFPQFVAITLSILTSDGIDTYQPTLVSPEIRSIRVLEGVPAHADELEALQDWIIRCGPPESYYFAVRSGLNEVTAGSCVSSKCEFVSIREINGRFESSTIAEPKWWRINR